MKPTYRILEEKYYDEKGVSIKTKYTVQRLRNILGLYIWFYVNNPDFDYKCPVNFISTEYAEDFIVNVLCKNAPRSEWVKTHMKTITC